jgi:hypothetical protein
LKKLLYYITDNGRGHATRSVAIIRELQKLNFEITIRNSNLVQFLKNSLPDIKIINGLTDVGASLETNGIFIDEIKTKHNVNNWIDKLNYYTKIECDIISKIDPNLIISDISAMPFLAAKQMKKKSIAISNFSWYDVLKFLPDDKLEFLKNAYDIPDGALQLPMGTTMDHFKTKKKVGLVSRIPQKSRKELRDKFGIKDSDIVITFALGGSEIEIKEKPKNNIKILSMNTKIKNVHNAINLTNWDEGQEIVAASDMVVCKCGYGIISECLNNGIFFNYLADDKHLEQKAMSQEISKNRWGRRMTFEELKQFQFNDIGEKHQNIKRIPRDTKSVIRYISEFLEN